MKWAYDRAEVIADGIVHALGVALGVAGVLTLLIQVARACARYRLTTGELSWQIQVDRNGLQGLRATRVQEYRSRDRHLGLHDVRRAAFALTEIGSWLPNTGLGGPGASDCEAFACRPPKMILPGEDQDRVRKSSAGARRPSTKESRQGHLCDGTAERVRLLPRHRRSLLRRVEPPHRPALDHHVHRPPGLGQCMMISAGWYNIFQQYRRTRDSCTRDRRADLAAHLEGSPDG